MSDEKAPVTLEGIAAVLATVPALLGHVPQKEQQPALSDALGMLSRACVMAGGKKGPPSGSETESLYREPDYSADDSTEQSRAAVAAVGAMLEPFRCAGEHDHTGALSRLIAENKALKEDEAWVEQTVRLISQSEKNVHLAVKAGSNLPEAVGVLLKEREHLSTLLEESGFPSGFRGAYTLFARIQELVVTWRKAEEAGTRVPLSLLSENEKRFRAEVADRLCAIIAPDRKDPVDMDWVESKVRWLVWFRQEHADLEAASRCLRLRDAYKRGHGDGQSGLCRSVADNLLKDLGIEKTIHDPVLNLDLGMIKVAEAVADANKWREREKTATDIRDAALDEAERIATTMASNNTVAANGASTSDLAVTYRTRAAAFQEMALECRALKSKPALQPAKNPGELQQAAPTWEPDSQTDLPDEEQSPRALTPEQERELAEHREAREEATRSVDALATSDVHDFGWALAQMRAGNKVRRREWAAQNYEGCWWLVKAEDGTSWWRASTSFGQEPRHLLATDWEVVE